MLTSPPIGMVETTKTLSLFHLAGQTDQRGRALTSYIEQVVETTKRIEKEAIFAKPLVLAAAWGHPLLSHSFIDEEDLERFFLGSATALIHMIKEINWKAFLPWSPGDPLSNVHKEYLIDSMIDSSPGAFTIQLAILNDAIDSLPLDKPQLSRFDVGVKEAKIHEEVINKVAMKRSFQGSVRMPHLRQLELLLDKIDTFKRKV